MKFNNKIIYLFLAVLLAACQEDEIHKFLDINRIQFGNVKTIADNYDTSLSDSVQSYTFVYSSTSVQMDTAYFEVFTSGGPVDYDRYYTLTQILVDTALNAEPGVHFLALNSEDRKDLQCIKAGEVSSQCGIVVLRDTSLLTQEVELNIELLESDDFGLGNYAYLYRKLFITDQLTRPNRWNVFIETYYGGKYSKAKHRYMIDVTGKRWDDEFFDHLMTNYAELVYWFNEVKQALALYNNEHPNDPLRDENGNLIEFK